MMGVAYSEDLLTELLVLFEIESICQYSFVQEFE